MAGGGLGGQDRLDVAAAVRALELRPGRPRRLLAEDADQAALALLLLEKGEDRPDPGRLLWMAGPGIVHSG